MPVQDSAYKYKERGILNVMRTIVFLSIISLFTLMACEIGNHQPSQLVREWYKKEVLFPSELIFTVGGKDTIANPMLRNTPYKIISYVDSSGCVSCKLQLQSWKMLLEYLKVEFQGQVPVYLFFCPKGNIREIRHFLARDVYDYPICIDVSDSFNRLNHFPTDMNYQTFLLDKDNKVLAIGNPVLNPKVKDLYLKIIQGKPVGEEEERERVETTVSVSSSILSMGEFPYREASSGSFTFTNTGKELWVIQDVVTSCGCLTVEYPKEPVRPGGQAVLQVTYRADHPGYFDKTLTVYSNAADSPLRLRVTGSAVE